MVLLRHHHHLLTSPCAVNGTTEQKLDRLAIREICEGWPCHRDAQEWSRYRACFAPNAYVFTTWSAGKTIDEFIEVSKKGFKYVQRARLMF